MRGKVDHVVAALKRGHSGGHHCHWPNCNASVPPAAYSCRKHWRALPKSIRDAIWQTYRPGQEASKKPSLAYVEAAKAAQDWIAQNYPQTQGELL